MCWLEFGRPKSSKYMRHLPDPVVVNFLIVNILLPILTGIVSGLLTTWAGGRDEKKDIASIKSQLLDLRDTLDKIKKTRNFDDDIEKEFDNTADDILRLRDQVGGSIRPRTADEKFKKKLSTRLSASI